MQELLFEGIAFGISVIAFIYGLLKVYTQKAPFYFKMIISAVGCYALEELWVIVQAVCNIESSFISVRLIGVFGCFCTFLTANGKGIDKIVDDGIEKNKLAKMIAFVAPVAFVVLFCLYTIMAIKSVTISYIIIPFIMFLPLILDSYYELKHLIIPMDDLKLLKAIRPISALILFEYIISFSYLFIQSETFELCADILSAIVMAVIVILSEKGAKKWKTLI